MTRPRVSILITVRDEARYLPAALRSLQRQTFSDWELVAVDDGSRDATPAILRQVAAQDARIRIITQDASGLVPALNAGLIACRAPLVARMDGDDICHPQRLARQVAYLDQHPETTLVTCRVRHFPRHDVQGGFRAYETWQNALLDHEDIIRDRFIESPFAHPSVVFRTDAVRALGGYRDMGWAEDYDLWLRLAETCARFARLPELLFFWRDRPDRYSRTNPCCSLKAFRDCKAHFLRRGFLAERNEVTLWGAGLEGKAWRKVLTEHGVRVTRWIEIDPRKVGQTIHGAPVLGHDALMPDLAPILVTIGARGARRQVREFASQRGLVEGRDFVCVT